MISFLAEITNAEAELAGKAALGLSGGVLIFISIFLFVMAVLAFLIPYFIYSIHMSLKRQTIMIEQLVKNSVAISQQLSRLPQAPPPGARR